MNVSWDPEIIYLLSDVTVTEVMISNKNEFIIDINFDTFVNIFKMMNLLFGLKVKYFDGFVIGSGNNTFVIRCDSH